MRDIIAAEIEAEEAILRSLTLYAGRCIAVRDHRVIAVADTWEDVPADIRYQDGVSLREIPVDPYARYRF